MMASENCVRIQFQLLVLACLECVEECQCKAK